MKLLLERWKRFLNEEQETNPGLLLYHATCFPPESFADGIDVTRAKGYGQGAGFYFFTSKIYAIKHAKALVDPNAEFNKEEKCPGNKSYIVISDEPVTPENFDIDYEVYGSALAQFMIENEDFFDKNGESLGLRRNIADGKVFRKTTGSIVVVFDRKVLQDDSGTKALNLTREPGDDYGASDGEIFSAFASKLNEQYPEMFIKFEKQFLSGVSKQKAVKYNGQKKIYPLRIEDLDGNIVWNRY